MYVCMYVSINKHIVIGTAKCLSQFCERLPSVAGDIASKKRASLFKFVANKCQQTSLLIRLPEKASFTSCLCLQNYEVIVLLHTNLSSIWL